MVVQKFNNGKSSNNFMIVIVCDETYDNDKGFLENWVTSCLNIVPIVTLDGEIIKWFMTNDMCFKETFQSSEPSNIQKFFIHIGENESLIGRSDMSAGGLLVSDEKYFKDEIIVNPLDIMNSFDSYPSYITTIAVSGISNNYMKEMWELFKNSSSLRVNPADHSRFINPMLRRINNTTWESIDASIDTFGWD